MNATTVTVTRIGIRTNTDSIFGEMSTEDIAATDVDATIDTYLAELIADLKTDFPQANISARHDSVYRTEVSIDTDQDGTRDDDTDQEVWATRQRVQDAVDDAAARVWEGGTFWVEREA